MKMAKWFIEDSVTNGQGNVYIQKGDDLCKAKERSIYKASRVEFKLLYNNQDKMIGYRLKYKYDQIFPKYSTFNSFGIVYNRKENVNVDKITFEVLFEDQVVRLIGFEHPNKIKDYMLVGRWRATNTNKIIDETKGDYRA